MYRIVTKRVLNPTVSLMEIEAPAVARKAEPGQFIILRVDEEGERIPLTIADFDREKGTVTIIYQGGGATTEKLNHKEEGQFLQDFVGPLGRATETEGLKRVAVVGGGNVAMDAVRTARRLGAEATIVYRRSENELPARAEEVHHAKEEGIEFRMLTNPTAVLGDDKGWVRGLNCVEMELGEPDASGRRSPVEKPGSDFEIECDVVVMALGTSPNPLLSATTSGLETTRRGCLVADEEGATTRPGVFAGGDAVTGAATVILAMGAGRKAARAIDAYVRSKA